MTGILLQPYMPEKAATLLDMLGVEAGRRGFDDAVIRSDKTYGVPTIGVGKCAFDSLFAPLMVED